jgi:choline dehydrogenase-like flavoprotein
VDAGRITRQISDPDYRVLVAEAGGEIIGFAMVVLCEASLNAEGFYKAHGTIEQGWQDRVSRRGVISRVVWMKKLRPDRDPG